MALEYAFDDRPGAAAPELRLPGGGGRVLRVRGSIDRVDLGATTVHVLDYKRTLQPRSADRHFQLGLYAAVAGRDLAPQAQQQQLAWLGLGDGRRQQAAGHEGPPGPAAAQLAARLWGRLDGLLAGDIAPDPDGLPLCARCDFAALCHHAGAAAAAAEHSGAGGGGGVMPVAAATMLRASAGTGKTYQLVAAYVRLLDSGLPPSAIVAITFTRKAAGELRGRIRAALLARQADAEVLAALQHAPINNFHGLALQLLQGAGLQAGYTAATVVLGQADADAALFAQACEHAWFAPGDGRGCRAAVQALAPHFDLDTALPQAMWQALGRAREDCVAPDLEALIGTYAPQPVQAAAHAQLLAQRAQLLAAGAGLAGAAARKLAALAAAELPAPEAAAAPWAAGWTAAFATLDRRGHLGKIYTAAAAAAAEALVAAVVGEHEAARLAPPMGHLLRCAWEQYGAAKRRLHAVDFGDLIADAGAAHGHPAGAAPPYPRRSRGRGAGHQPPAAPAGAPAGWPRYRRRRRSPAVRGR